LLDYKKRTRRPSKENVMRISSITPLLSTKMSVRRDKTALFLKKKASERPEINGRSSGKL